MGRQLRLNRFRIVRPGTPVPGSLLSCAVLSLLSCAVLFLTLASSCTTLQDTEVSHRSKWGLATVADLISSNVLFYTVDVGDRLLYVDDTLSLSGRDTTLLFPDGSTVRLNGKHLREQGSVWRFHDGASTSRDTLAFTCSGELFWQVRMSGNPSYTYGGSMAVNRIGERLRDEWILSLNGTYRESSTYSCQFSCPQILSFCHDGGGAGWLPEGTFHVVYYKNTYIMDSLDALYSRVRTNRYVTTLGDIE